MDAAYDLIVKTSISFKSIIWIDDRQAKDALTIMYLVLRALDTIEDDPVMCIEERVLELLCFDKSLSRSDPRKLCVCNDSKYAPIMESFHDLIVPQMYTLPAWIIELIRTTSKDMAMDMAWYLLHPVATWEDYDKYSWSVSGRLVVPIIKILTNDPSFDGEVGAIGGVVQRINIIRDLVEDAREGRCYWPRVDVLQRYCGTELVDDLFVPGRVSPAAKKLALRAMIRDALATGSKGGVWNISFKISGFVSGGRKWVLYNSYATMLYIIFLHDNMQLFEEPVKLPPEQVLEAIELVYRNDNYYINTIRAIRNKVIEFKELASRRGDQETASMVNDAFKEMFE